MVSISIPPNNFCKIPYGSPLQTIGIFALPFSVQTLVIFGLSARPYVRRSGGKYRGKA
jgi:hypothetical protein